MTMSKRQSIFTAVLSISFLLSPLLTSAQTATYLHDGDRVMGTSALNIRSTPGTSGTVIGQLPTSSSVISLGTIRCDLTGSTACPTTANGYYWWYIDWDSSTLPSGWSAEGNSGDLYITSASLLDLYASVYDIYSDDTWTTPEDLSQALIDINSSNETTASRANVLIQTTLALISEVAGAFAGPISGILITEFLNYLLAPDLSTGYWNNSIKGALYSNATAGVETANLVLDLLNATGLVNIPTDFLVGQVAPITNSIMPYYATAQGGVGGIKASDTVTGGYGSPEEYTANFTRAQQGLTALVTNLLNRGVLYEDFGRIPVSGQWAWQTMDLANPLQDFYYRGAAKYDAEANTLMGATTLACYGPPEWTKDYSELGGYKPMAYIAGTWDETMNAGVPYPPLPTQFTSAALFETAKGAGEIEGARAESLITDMYGGAFWTAFARMGVGGQTMQNLIQQNFDPWAVVRTWEPDTIVAFVAEKTGLDPQQTQNLLTPIGCTQSAPTSPSSPSKKFITGDRVQATANLNVRQTSSINGTLLGTQPAGAYGSITGGPKFTDGYNWWTVNYEFPPDGWSAEDYLEKSLSFTPPPASTPSPAPALPDLTAGDPWVPPSITVGQLILFNDATTNASTVNSEASQMSFKVDGVNVTGSPVSVPALNPWTTSASLSPSNWTATLGSHTLVVCADANGVVTESNESNNCFSEAFAVVPASTPSTKFIINDHIQTTTTVNVRQTPSTSGTLLGTQPTGSLGAVIGGPVSADGFNWWNVNYENAPDGWSAEDYLIKATVVNTSNNASCGTVSTPSSVTPGQVFSASIAVANSGTKAWSSPEYWLSAVTSSGSWIDRWVAGGGLDLPFSPVNSGQSTTFNMSATAPTTAGTYDFSWQMIQEGAEFFGPVCTKQITVSSTQVTDTTKPAISITSPLNGATVSGIVNVYANATDNVGVSRVEFYVDSVLKFTATTSPYFLSWLATPVGSHTLTAKAYDAAGNVGQSSAVTVNVPTAITNSAQFVSQSVPSSMIAGQSYPVSVTMKNTGANTWSPIGPQINAYRLRSENPTDNFNWNTTARAELPTTVPAGGQVTINFTVTAPTTAGTYNFQWRMVQEGVQGFGAYTTNVPVVVVSATNTDVTPPTISITSPANGSTVSGLVNATVNAQDNVGIAKVEYYVDSYFMTSIAQSPYSASFVVQLGSHTLTAKAYDTAGKIGQSQAVTVNILIPVTNSSQFISQSVPATMIVGQSYPVSVTMKNIGTGSWGLIGPQVNAYRLRSENPTDNFNWNTTARAELPTTVPAGGQVTINFTITAPATAGTYNFQWRMLQEGVQGFGLPSQNVAISVTGSQSLNNGSTANLASVLISLINALEQMKLLLK